MNTCEAMMAAADQIEQNPKLFNFGSVRIPTGCGTPGCALGWVGFYLGTEDHHEEEGTYDKACGLTGVAIAMGYEDLKDGWYGGGAAPDFYCAMQGVVGNRWTLDADLCAKGLRILAERHKPKDAFGPWLNRLKEQIVAPESAVV